MNDSIVKGLKAGTGGVRKGQGAKLSAGAWIACGVTDCEGVALATAAEGEAVDVQTSGPVTVEVASALTLLSIVSVNADGRFVNNTTTATHLKVGKALSTGAAADGTNFAFARVDLDLMKIAN